MFTIDETLAIVQSLEGRKINLTTLIESPYVHFTDKANLKIEIEIMESAIKKLLS